jgi:membrane protease subunit HflC
VQNYESKFETILTPDGYNLLIMDYAGWTLSEPMVFFPRFEGSVTKAEESLDGLVRNAYSTVAGKHPFSHFISTDPNEIQFETIEREILERVQKDVQSSGYGIQVDFLGIKQLNLPESVTEAVFKQMRAEREVLVSQIKSEGTERASAIRTAAELDSAKLLADAQSVATKIISQGEAEAAKYYRVFEQNPELAKFLFKLSTLEAFLKDNTTLVLDKNTSPLELLQTPGLRIDNR